MFTVDRVYVGVRLIFSNSYGYPWKCGLAAPACMQRAMNHRGFEACSHSTMTDAEAMDDRKAAQSLDFEQFHALRNRRRNKANAESANASVADEEKDDATAAPAQPEQRVKLSDTVGDFVEMHEVQLVVILLIVADVVAVVLELFIDLGALGQSAAVTQLSSLPMRSRALPSSFSS